MADKWPLANGNWSNAANWNDGTKPGPGDDVFADGRTVTIDEDVTVASIRTTQRSGGTAGGGFTLNAGITVTADVIAGVTACLTRTVAGAESRVVGNVLGTSTNAAGLFNSSTGTVVITGDVNAGTNPGSFGIENTSTGEIIIIGNVTGGLAANAWAIRNSSAGPITITGNVTGGSSTSNAPAIQNTSGLVTVTGNVTGGTAGTCDGITNTGIGEIIIIGNVTGGSGTSTYGIRNNSIAPVTITGDVTGGSTAGAFAVFMGSTALIRINGDVVPSAAASALGSNSHAGRFAISGGLHASPTGFAPYGGAKLSIEPTGLVSHAYATNDDAIVGPTRTLSTAGDDQANAADVRFGTTYAAGSRTGTLRVPDPEFVNAGVLTDDTIGTLSVDLQPILDAIGAIDVDLNPVLDKLPTTGRALSDEDYVAPLDATETQQAAAAAILEAELATATIANAIREDIGVLLGPQERRVTFTVTHDNIGVSGVRVTTVGTSRTGFTNVNGLLSLNLPQSVTAYVVRVSPPLGFDPVDDINVTVDAVDVSVPIALSLTPIDGPEDPSLIPVLVNLFTQFGEPCVAAKVVVEVIGDPAMASLAALTNVDNISHTGTNGQARINLYRGQTYRFTLTYKRYPSIVLLRTLPTTGDSFVVTQVIS